jgi:hypothetical protein
VISGWGDSSKGRFLLEDKNKYLIIIQKGPLMLRSACFDAN